MMNIIEQEIKIISPKELGITELPPKELQELEDHLFKIRQIGEDELVDEGQGAYLIVDMIKHSNPKYIREEFY